MLNELIVMLREINIGEKADEFVKCYLWQQGWSLLFSMLNYFGLILLKEAIS